MPTYVYRCRTCDQRLEKVQRFDDEPLRECPGCRGELQRVIHAVGIIFKGSGFYSTDSRKSKPESESASAGGESKEATASSTPSVKETVSASKDR